MTSAAGRVPPIGVVVVGNLSTRTGVSHMNRLLLQSLRAAGLPVLPVPLDDRVAAVRALRDLPGFRDAHSDLRCIASHTVDRLPLLAGFLQRPELDAAHRVALWHWEFLEPPADMSADLALFDEFWAVSHHAAVALQRAAGPPVRVFPVPIPDRSAPRPAGSSSGPLTFLTTFDHLSLSARKNPLGVIQAFRAAFPRPATGGPRLVVKSRGADRAPTEHGRLQSAAAGRPDITVVDRTLPDDAQADLIAGADVLVSLHRAEGYGLTLAQAMAAGTVAMGTAWSGNLDFMTRTNSALVPYRMTHAPPGLWNVPPAAWWAEPDLEAATATMHRLATDHRWRGDLRARAHEDVLTRHPVSRTATWLRGAVAVAGR